MMTSMTAQPAHAATLLATTASCGPTLCKYSSVVFILYNSRLEYMEMYSDIHGSHFVLFFVMKKLNLLFQVISFGSFVTKEHNKIQSL